MRLLVVDECCYTRLGVAGYVAAAASNVSVKCCASIEQAMALLQNDRPSVVLVNMTAHCRNHAGDTLLPAFIAACQPLALYMYIDAPYPASEQPLQIAEHTFLFRKAILASVLQDLPNTHQPWSTPLFSPQEQAVMKYWMAQWPTHQIARKLHISPPTVYVHKRHITEKIHTRNRLEFYALYHLLRFYYPPYSGPYTTGGRSVLQDPPHRLLPI
ncbi:MULTISPECIES: helix-turn-helix transcriptional regulator [Gibbsiella]|uniref:LuxR family transcriptional regulator n=1 Tax=Gibbsiella dentisursi TaxID=796890 RepID=A0ABP7KYP1_9GAMM|nr:LuxR family transcriptional regulator [Gibbsiella quercinecans]